MLVEAQTGVGSPDGKYGDGCIEPVGSNRIRLRISYHGESFS
jgi:hypothetical protein